MILLTAPTVEPVTADEAKAAARISGTTEFDALVAIYIKAAREMAEVETGVRWMAQEWRSEFGDWPKGVITAYRPSVVAVSYWNGSAWVSMTNGTFDWADADPGLTIAPLYGQSWPTLGERSTGARVRVGITMGATSAATVPAVIKLFIMAMVAYWIDNPEAFTDRQHHPAPYLRDTLDAERVRMA